MKVTYRELDALRPYLVQLLSVRFPKETSKQLVSLVNQLNPEFQNLQKEIDMVLDTVVLLEGNKVELPLEALDNMEPSIILALQPVIEFKLPKREDVALLTDAGGVKSPLPSGKERK